MNKRDTLNIDSEGNLSIGGIEVGALAAEYGTPLYVMDKSYIELMCSVFTETLRKEYGDGLVSYASKAFCCKEIYRIINKYGLGADVVSGGEIFTALSAGFPADKLTLHGNNKTVEELEYAVKSGVGEIVIDSVSEINEIDALASGQGITQNVMIRVNPGIEAHTHHYIQTAKPDSKFGFSVADGTAEKIIKLVSEKKNLKLVGLHCHIGSQIFEKKSFAIAVDKMTDFYLHIKNDLGIEFEALNLGGGFGIYYTDGDPELKTADYADYIKVISDELKRCVAEKGIKKPRLMLEPGRSIVGEAGITVYTVGRIKEISGIKNYLSVNGGMFENPRYALYQAKYSVVAAEKMNEKPIYKYTVAGKCCESGDIIAEDVLLPSVKEGDLLAVLSTGAYNYSMSSNYNRNVVPPVVMVENGEAYYAVKPQKYEDVASRDL